MAEPRPQVKDIPAPNPPPPPVDQPEPQALQQPAQPALVPF